MSRLLLLLTAGLLLAGCATRQLVPDFATFSEAYARDMNWQMLLNLARLDQGHPAYFMAIGEIRMGRTQNISLNSSGTSSHTTSQNVATAITRTAQNVLSGTITPNASANANPTFVFIPINSEEAARQMLEPISIEAFNTLYQQGWPVDQLLRVLVERIEVEIAPKTAGGASEQFVLTNSPLRADATSFTRFLRTCEVIRDLQRAGGLSLLTQAREVEDEAGAGAGKKTPPAPKPGSPGKGDDSRRDKQETEAKKTIELIYHFKADEELLERIAKDYAVRPPFHGEELERLVEIFKNANLLVCPRNEPPKKTAGMPATRAVLILRSFRSIIDAVAKEQRAYDALAANPGFVQEIPARQRQPILRTVWPKDQKAPLLAPVIRVSYFGDTYQVTDPANLAPQNLDSRWNRDVFRLLVDLSFQVTVDITKFQRQVLELTQ